MNTVYQLQQIKSIPIADYLSSLGIQAVKRYGSYALYHAPYRDDHNASLKVDFTRNLWYDFGLCRGGSIIDLVMLLKGCGIREAIAELTGEATSSFLSSAIVPKQSRAITSPPVDYLMNTRFEMRAFALSAKPSLARCLSLLL